MAQDKVLASRTLLHTVAKMHYVSDMPQVEIARRLDLSTATVSRLIKRAREEGIVRIEVRELAAEDAIASELAGRLGLQQAIVVDSTHNGGGIAALAAPVHALLQTLALGPDSIMAIGWGRTVWEVVRSGMPRLPGVTLVPCSGGLDELAQHYQVNEFLRVTAEQTGGLPRFIHAPFLPADRLREFIVADKATAQNLELWDRIDVALVGIGPPYAVEPAVGGPTSAPRDPGLATAAGDVLRHYYDAEGRPLTWAGESRLLAVTPDQLRRTPVVIGAAASRAKAASILGAARARLINVLVTDLRAAEAVLELVGRGSA
jgi:DNA-binding transcriptional regulator LsrR (DeoR family)